jgi:hypothetical protein
MVAVKDINLQMLCFVAERLDPLLDQLVFLGGCTTTLFVTDTGAPDVRATHDVDVIVEVLSHKAYWQLEERLRALGCVQMIDEEVTCRWNLDGMTLYVMPTDESILRVPRGCPRPLASRPCQPGTPAITLATTG